MSTMTVAATPTMCFKDVVVFDSRNGVLIDFFQVLVEAVSSRA